MGTPVRGGFHILLGEDDEEERHRLERNYRRLEDFRSGSLVGLGTRMQERMAELYRIYNNYLDPYENLDDSYRSRINGIYDDCTSGKDKWNNFWESFGNVAGAFLKAFVVAAVGIILVNTPKESVPSWLQGAKDAADGVAEEAVKVMEEGPGVLVDDIGQGFMDQIQTPEGIAIVLVSSLVG